MPPEEPADPEPWYADGLRFGCTRCGNCCTGSHGAVRVSDVEIAALARRQEMTDEEFRASFTRPLRGGDISLRERRDGACIFYAAGTGCRVYPDRPRQCRTWPFWRAVVHSTERWAEEARECPGMDQGPRHEAIEIRSILEREGDGTSGAM